MDVVIHQHHQDDGNQEFSKSLQGCEATDLKEKKSIMIKVLNSVGAHEIFSSEVCLIYQMSSVISVTTSYSL
jgi:hypothetical protein